MIIKPRRRNCPHKDNVVLNNQHSRVHMHFFKDNKNNNNDKKIDCIMLLICAKIWLSSHYIHK